MPSRNFPSFVNRGSRSVDVWSPRVTNDWAHDLVQGRSYAEEMVFFMRNSGHPTLLQHVVKAMIAHACWSGVEVGFFQYLSAEMIGDDNLKDIRLGARES